MKLKIFLFAALGIQALILPNMLFAQAESSIFAPFVSHLSAQVSGQNVVLSWTDSSSVKGPVYIYRSMQTFDNRFYPDMQYTTVYYGRQNFTDTVPSLGVWYYLVIASDVNHQKYDTLVAHNNMVQMNVDGGSHVVYAGDVAFFNEAAESLTDIYKRQHHSGELELLRKSGGYVYDDIFYKDVYKDVYWDAYQRPHYSGVLQWYRREDKDVYWLQDTYRNIPVVTTASSTLLLTSLSAIPEGNCIRINFVSANSTKNAVLYRHITPIRTISDLLVSEVAQLPGVKAPFIDYVTAGIPYYYAVVYEEDLRTGTACIVPGYNTTLYPVIVQQETVSGSYYPDIALAPQRQSSRLSPEAEAALSRNTFTPVMPYPTPAPYSTPAPPYSIPVTPYMGSGLSQTFAPQQSMRQPITDPQIFQQDLQNSPAGTDENKLQTIIKGPFTWRYWRQSISELERLLSGLRISSVEGRARFYLGQAYYFASAYDKALVEFLAVQSRFPEESAMWIQAALSAIAEKR